MDILGGLLLTFILATTFLYLILIKPRANKLPLPPGPPAWPILGNLPQLGSKPHQTLHSMSKVYGPLLHLRFGSVPVIVASSSSLASLFLKTYDANFSSRPFNSFAQILAYGARDIAWAPYGPRWRALRKMYSLHLFTAKALDGSSHVRQEEAAALVAGLAKVGGAMVDVGNWLNSCTADTLGRGMVGKRLFGGPSISNHVGGGAGGGENEEVKEFKEMAVELMRLAGEFNLADCVPWLRWVDVGGVRGRMLRIAKRFDAFLEKVIREHEEGGATGGDAEEHRDMLSILIGLKGNEIEGGNLTHLEIKALLANMFVAGTDTSSSTAEWALSELIRHPDLLKRAQQELDSVVGRDRLVAESDIPKLPFFQAVIKETFRLHPSTPLLLPRISTDSSEINGYRIPKNATVLINAWAIARDPAAWTDPLEFRPGRFLPGGENEHKDIKGNDFDIIPFGSGRRICIGMNWGMRMVQLMTAALIHAFDWELPAGQLPEKLSMEEDYGLTLQRAVPLTAAAKPRLAPQVYGSTTGA